MRNLGDRGDVRVENVGIYLAQVVRPWSRVFCYAGVIDQD